MQLALEAIDAVDSPYLLSLIMRPLHGSAVAVLPTIRHAFQLYKSHSAAGRFICRIGLRWQFRQSSTGAGCPAATTTASQSGHLPLQQRCFLS
jgi:hypothetical protein